MITCLSFNQFFSLCECILLQGKNWIFGIIHCIYYTVLLRVQYWIPFHQSSSISRYISFSFDIHFLDRRTSFFRSTVNQKSNFIFYANSRKNLIFFTTKILLTWSFPWCVKNFCVSYFLKKAISFKVFIYRFNEAFNVEEKKK